MKLDLNILSQNLKRLMGEQGLDATHLARACGVSPSTMTRIVNKQATPRMKTVSAAAEILNVSVGELLGLDDKTNPAALKKAFTVPHKKIPLIAASDAVAFVLEDKDSVFKRVENEVTWIPGLPDERLSAKVSFCVRVEEDVMSPAVKRGDYCYFKKLTDIRQITAGCIVIAALDGKNVGIRRAFVTRSHITLCSSEELRHVFPDVTIPLEPRDGDDIGVIGVMVAHLQFR